MSEEESTPEAPVTGQGRMDVAWGANTGDEHPDEVQRASTPQSGEIFEQLYTPWTGQLNPRWMRNWSILRHHLLGIFKKRTPAMDDADTDLHSHRLPRLAF